MSRFHDEFFRVSILVFLELALGQLSVCESCLFTMFQSLFSWNLPSDYC